MQTMQDNLKEREKIVMKTVNWEMENFHSSEF